MNTNTNRLLKAYSAAHALKSVSRASRFVAAHERLFVAQMNRRNLATITNLRPLLSLPTTFRFHCCCRCYSSSSSSSPSRKGTTKNAKKSAAAKDDDDDEKDAFFVVRKGDVIGVYKSFSDCQALLGSSSICDPPVSVYKGYSLRKETQEYLVSCGLKGAVYSITAAHLKPDLFGVLASCPLQEAAVVALASTDNASDHEKLDHSVGTGGIPIDGHSCVIEFDGASKGNPGLAGAGAVLRATDGTLIYRLREGLGKATCNVAEYRAIILGLKYALEKGYTHIRVQGDSKLVCQQLLGRWKVESKNTSELYEQAKLLKKKFKFFQIHHVPRELNSEADAQANLAVQLPDGEVQEELVAEMLVGSSTS